MNIVKIKYPKNEIDTFNYDLKNNIVQDTINSMVKDINDKMEFCVRNFALPPISGQLTKGKLRWRGIRLIIADNGNKRWIEQRGQKISPVFVLKVTM